MAKEKQTLTFAFVNPNTPKAFEARLRRLLIDRLNAMHKRNSQ